MSQPSSGDDPLLQLAEDFAARVRRGERPSLTEYANKYPELAKEIRDLFPAMVVMEEFGSVAGAPAGPEGGPAVDRCKVPQQLGEYRILREVGHGGMGFVYEAVQESLGRHVALKVLPFHSLLNPTLLERFRREARAAAQLHHTNIVPVFGIGEHEGTHYYAMQFIQGQGLDDVLKEVRRLRDKKEAVAAASSEPRQELTATIAEGLLTGQFAGQEAKVADVAPSPSPSPPVGGEGRGEGALSSSPPLTLSPHSEMAAQSQKQYFRSVARVGVQVAEALAYAHKQKILHRDIKPSNLLLDTQGTVWISDFGLAKAEGSDELTMPGDIIGTLRYMAPERFQGKADSRSDVYSLGMALYELLTLRPAFEDINRARLMDRVRHEEPPRPRQLDPQIARDLETIVLKAIAKEPADRYPTADEMTEDLRLYLADRPIRARRSSLAERAWRLCRRNPLVSGLTAVVAASLLAGTGVSAYFAIRADDRARDAIWHKDRANDKATEAEENAAEAWANLYAVHMNLAQVAWENGDVGRVLDLLDLYRHPPPGRKDVRGWEWYYQERLCHAELRTLKGFNAGIFSVTVSPDGQRLASAGQDGMVKIWDAANGHELRTLKAHTNMVYSVVFSPDGQRLASAGEDGMVKIWDAANGHELRTLKGHTRPVNSVAFSPDGQRLASASRDRTVKVWDAASGQELGNLKGQTNQVVSVAFSPDGQWLASASHDRTVKVWDAATGRELRTLKGHTDGVESVAFSPDGQWLASASHDRTVKVWDAATGQELRTFRGHTKEVYGVVFSPDGQRLASTGWDQTVKVWDVSTGLELGTLKGHTRVIYHSVAFSPDGQRLVSGSWDQTVKVWDATIRQEFRTFKAHVSQVSSVAFSPDRQWLASASVSEVKLCDAASGQQLRTLKGGTDKGHTDSFHCVVFSPNAQQLACGGAGFDSSSNTGYGQVKLFDVATGQELRTLKGHAREVSSLAFSSDGKWLASASDDHTVKVWDPASGRDLRTLKGHTLMVMGVAFSPDGRQLASGSWDQTVKVWDAASGQELRTLKGHTRVISSVAFSPDGRQLASASWDQTVKLWDTASGWELRTFNGHTGPVYCVVFSPDGRRLASASYDQTVKVWDVRTGQELRTLRGHTREVSSVAFNPDGQGLASGSWDATVKVWDARPLTPEVRIEREARGLLEFLFARPLCQADVIDYVRRSPLVRPEVRDEALALVDRYQEETNPEAFHLASWVILRQRYLKRLQYQFALRQAETACRLAPGKYRTALGVAQYRLAQYRDAEDTLERTDQLHNGSPAHLAFLSMAQYELGEKEKARASLNRLRRIVNSPSIVGARNEEAQGFLREAEALVNEKPADPAPWKAKEKPHHTDSKDTKKKP